MSASLNLSLRMQYIAQSLAEVLEEVAGEPIAFVLVLSADKTAQYVSNASRAEGKEMIETLLARWKMIGLLITSANSLETKGFKAFVATNLASRSPPPRPAVPWLMSIAFITPPWTKTRHKTLRVTPAMEAGIADHVWTIEEIVRLVPEPVAAKRGPYKARQP